MLSNFIYPLSGGASVAPASTLTIEGMSYPHNEGVYLTNQLGHPHAFIGYQYYPIIWTIKDKSFLHWNQRNGTPYNNESMIVVYDHATKKLSDSFAWGEINAPNSDVHLIAGIIGTADNRLLMMEENPHIGPMHVKRSGTNYGVSTYTYHGSFSDELAYPHLHRTPNGNLYSIFRASTSANGELNQESGTNMWRSTDNGVTWTDRGFLNFFPWNGTINEWAYPLSAWSGTDELHLFVSHRRGIEPVSFPLLYHVIVKDTDAGVIVRNIQNTFSKNTTVNGFLTTAEIQTHCTVLKYGTGSVGDGVIRANGAFIVNGVPYVIGGHNDDARSLRFIYWTGSAWVSKAIAVAGHNIYGAYIGGSADPNTTIPFNNNTVIIHKGGSTFDVYCMEDVGGYSQMSQFRTTNTGDTWSFVRQLTSGNYNHWNAQASANQQEFGKGIVACVRRAADGSYGDLFIEEIKA